MVIKLKSYPHRFCPVFAVWPCVCQSKPCQFCSPRLPFTEPRLPFTELSNRKLQPPESSSGHNATVHLHRKTQSRWNQWTTGKMTCQTLEGAMILFKLQSASSFHLAGETTNE